MLTVAALFAFSPGAHAQSFGAIGAAGDADAFRVTLEAGTIYVIHLVGYDDGPNLPLEDPYLRILDEDGNFIPGTADDNSGEGLNAKVIFAPTASGVYLIQASAAGDGTGDYALWVTLQRPVGRFDEGDTDVGHDTGTLGAVGVNSYPATAAIDPGDDWDWFRVRLKEGRRYQIDMEGVTTRRGTQPNPYLNGVMDSKGNFVQAGFTLQPGEDQANEDGNSWTNDDGGHGTNARLVFTPRADGLYHIWAMSRGHYTGTYELRVTDISTREDPDDYPADTSTPKDGAVAIGKRARGTIGSADDQDWFAVELEAGTTYQFDMEGRHTGRGSLLDPVIRAMYDARGALLPDRDRPGLETANDDGGFGWNARATYRPDAAGTYYVAADGGGTHTGTYTLEMTVSGGNTARFGLLPTQHDGKKRIRARVIFSEAIEASEEEMRAHGVRVEGGAATTARRLPPRDDGEKPPPWQPSGEREWEIEVQPDGAADVTISIPATEDCAAAGAVCTADGRPLSEGISVTVAGPEPDGSEPEPAPLTAEFRDMPESHDGETAFRFRVAFSEDIGIGYETLRDESFRVTNGDVTGARRVDGRHDLWEMTVAPDSREAVTVTLPRDRACGTAGAVCTRGEDPRPLTNSPSATVAGPADAPERNTSATGVPTISGTPQVGETLTASTAGISDADGLDNAGFAHRWMRGDADIQGATGSTYTAVAADEGERLKVRVSFTDDAGHAESLTSAATDAVAPAPEPLTASFEGMPGEHEGSGETFSFRVAFSAEIKISYTTLRDTSFTVTNGDITGARRVDKRRDLWEMTVEPGSNQSVAIRLPETRDCGASGAVCTSDGRPLSHSLSATVAGPVGISVADARVEEAEGAVLAFLVALSRAASGTLTVDYATADGSATAGDDYTRASGTLTFGAGESSKTIEVAVLDDAHDEGEETLTLSLSNASGGRVTDGEATGTIKNRDPLPRALLARFGRAAAVHVVEHVEERMAAPREPGFEGRFAGRQLRRGMEREMALEFLSRLGGAAGMQTAGGPMAGSPVAGAGALGTPGRGGMGMPGAAGRMGGGTGMPGVGAGRMGGAALMGTSPGAPGGAGPMGGAAGPDGGLLGGGLYALGLGGDSLLTGSSFALNRETGHGGILSFWSRGARSHFSGREGALSLGGDVRTTMFGADYAKGPLVAGLSLSHSRGLGEYLGASGGQVASAVTGLYPWLGYKATDRVTVWGVAGYGAGGILLTPDGGSALESALSMAMAAAGTRGELVAGGAGGFGLAFKADALWVGTSIDGVDGPAGRLAATEAAVTRFRTGLEGSRAYTLAGRLSLRPSVEVGLRHDGGDAETGAGMDIGGGLVVADSSTGLAVDVRVRILVVHQAEGFRERGVAVSFSYNPTPSTPLGFTARVAPAWGGQAMGGASALWGRETMGGLSHGGFAQGNRLDGEVGYGLPVGSRLVGTPRVGFSTSEYGQEYRMGYGLGVLDRARLNLELGVDAQRRESPMLGGTSNGVLGRASVGW